MFLETFQELTWTRLKPDYIDELQINKDSDSDSHRLVLVCIADSPCAHSNEIKSSVIYSYLQ